jgi:phosphate uptake regulator
MDDPNSETRRKLHSRLQSISENLTGLSQQKMTAINAKDWELAQRVQKKTAELMDLQAELMRQLHQLQF